MDMQPGQGLMPHTDSVAEQPQQSVVNAPPATVPMSEQLGTVALGYTPLPPAAQASTQQVAPLALDTNTAPEVQDDDLRYAQEADRANAKWQLPEDISWTASEFIEHPKDASWYGLLVLVGLSLAAVGYLVTKDVISTGVIIIVAAMFGFYAGHKPRTQQYHLSPQGLQIGAKVYNFQGFKNFSVTEEGAITNIAFIPLKRFAPPLAIYVSTDLEERVLDYLSLFLPFEQRHADPIEGLLRRIRF